MELTEEQKARIAHNKEVARLRLEERNKRLASNNSSNCSNIEISISSKPSTSTNAFFLQPKIASYSLNSNNSNKLGLPLKNLTKAVQNSNISKIHVEFFVQNRHRLKVSSLNY